MGKEDELLLAELAHYEPKGVSISILQRERRILDVLRLTIMEGYTIENACKEVGMHKDTWYNYVREGYVEGPLQQISKEVSQIAYDTILPSYQKIISGIVSIAMGVKPDGSDIRSIKASDMIAAFKQLNTIIPIRSVDGTTAANSELDHIESYQPQPVQVSIAGDFIYSGSNDDVKMGQMESIAPNTTVDTDIEGEFVEDLT